MQEIAIRVRLTEQDRVGLADYERIVGSVATVAALTAWLPTPDTRLVIRGRGAAPVRLETVSYGPGFEMLVVLDQGGAVIERAASTVAALVGSVRDESVGDDAVGIAGELDRLDRAAPRGRSAVERSLRAFLEGARADVLARRTTTTRVRAAQALLRLAEDGAEVRMERIDDALASDLAEAPVAALGDDGEAAVVEAVPGSTVSADETDTPVPVDGVGADVSEAGEEKAGGEEAGTANVDVEVDGKAAGGKQADQEKAGGKKAGGKKAGGKKADQEKAGRKKADQKKADQEKAGGEKADQEKAGGEKADQEKAGGKKTDQEKAGGEKAVKANADVDQDKTGKKTGKKSEKKAEKHKGGSKAGKKR